MSTKNESKCLTVSVEQAARLLGISRCTAYKLVQTGDLPARRVGPKLLRVPMAAIDEMLSVRAEQQDRRV